MSRTILLAAVLAAVAAPDLPPVERRAEALFDVLRDGDPKTTAAFVSEAFHPDFLALGPLELHLEQLSIMRRDLGAFEVDGIRLRSPHEGGFVLRAPDGRRFELTIDTEPVEPYRIAGIGLRPHAADRELPAFGSLDEADAFLERIAAKGRFGGVVLVARAGEPDRVRAYGEADRERGVANTPATRFDVGSITKEFTAVAVLQLAARGLVELEAPMGRYLDGFPKSIASRVRVIDLLKMESGYGDYFTPEFESRMGTIRSVSDYLPSFRTLELEFEPGTRKRYSNVGYVILGAIVERVSGTSYADYVREKIFEPAGMGASGFPDRTEREPSRAVGYTEDSGEPQPNVALFPPHGSPAGGSFSTAADLLRFQRALRANRLLDERLTTLLINRFEERDGRSPRRGVAGGAPGVSAVSLEDVEAGLSVIVLSNTDEPLAERVGQAIFEMLRETDGE